MGWTKYVRSGRGRPDWSSLRQNEPDLLGSGRIAGPIRTNRAGSVLIGLDRDESGLIASDRHALGLDWGEPGRIGPEQAESSGIKAEWA